MDSIFESTTLKLRSFRLALECSEAQLIRAESIEQPNTFLLQELNSRVRLLWPYETHDKVRPVTGEIQYFPVNPRSVPTGVAGKVIR